MRLDNLFGGVIVEATDCPEALALLMLSRSAREFCTESGIWEEDLEPIQLVAGAPEYDLDPQETGEVVRVVSATLDGADIDTTIPNDLPPTWRTDTGTPTAVMIEVETVRPYPTPTSAGTLVIRAALRPKLGTTSIPRAIEEWGEEIAAGALARLKAQADKPWSDRGAVAAYRETFKDAISAAQARAIRGRGNRKLRVRPASFV